MMRNRKMYLRVCAALAIGALAFSSLVSAGPPRETDLVISVGDTVCGPLRSVDGGVVSAEVIREPAGPSYFIKKHIGTPKYGELTATFGFGLSRALYDWIRQSWSMNYETKNVKVIHGDQIRTATNSLITATTFPALDTRLATQGAITLKFAPERITTSGGGAKIKVPTGVAEKPWLVSGFGLELAGLTASSVTRIESFTVEQSAVTDDIGDARDYAREPGKLEFPNLVVTVPQAASKSWTDWHKDFVIMGNNDESKEKAGTIRFFGTDRRELGRIQLLNVGIISAVPAVAADGAPVVIAELYVERMALE